MRDYKVDMHLIGQERGGDPRSLPGESAPEERGSRQVKEEACLLGGGLSKKRKHENTLATIINSARKRRRTKHPWQSAVGAANHPGRLHLRQRQETRLRGWRQRQGETTRARMLREGAKALSSGWWEALRNLRRKLKRSDDCLWEAIRHQHGCVWWNCCRPALRGAEVLCTEGKEGGWSPLPSHPFPCLSFSWLLSPLSIYIWYVILSFQNASSVRTETVWITAPHPSPGTAPALSSTRYLRESDEWAMWQAMHCGCDRDGFQVANWPGSFVNSDASPWEARRDKTPLRRKMVNQVTQSMFCEMCLMNDF